jgi:L-cysteine:1D-myo-inositol 2-amino-2-deoxy-alpha-D-glucopyranoside ligase
MAIRWALMKNHYRTDRMWTDELLIEAELDLIALRSCLDKTEVAPTSELISVIVNALSDDLDTQGVITSVNEWVGRTQSGEFGGNAQSLISALDSLLGIKL